jgi:hypothetical protein
MTCAAGHAYSYSLDDTVEIDCHCPTSYLLNTVEHPFTRFRNLRTVD